MLSSVKDLLLKDKLIFAGIFRLFEGAVHEFLPIFQILATSRRSIELQGPFYATTQISGRKYRYKTVSRHQLLTHQLRVFESAIDPHL
ncbi:hypothetical protein [Microcoleus sp. LAD1_D3]|uniref:hypothetical protein n=1 Tax=Microcoleus sp. LAD1_D3 TaxID=2819365 RepID=UPI002FD4813E